MTWTFNHRVRMFVESEDVLAHSFPQIHTYSHVNIFKGLVTDSFYYYYFSCESSHDAAVFTHSEASKHMGFFCVSLRTLHLEQTLGKQIFAVMLSTRHLCSYHCNEMIYICHLPCFGIFWNYFINNNQVSMCRQCTHNSKKEEGTIILQSDYFGHLGAPETSWKTWIYLSSYGVIVIKQLLI